MRLLFALLLCSGLAAHSQTVKPLSPESEKFYNPVIHKGDNPPDRNMGLSPSEGVQSFRDPPVKWKKGKDGLIWASCPKGFWVVQDSYEAAATGKFGVLPRSFAKAKAEAFCEPILNGIIEGDLDGVSVGDTMEIDDSEALAQWIEQQSGEWKATPHPKQEDIFHIRYGDNSHWHINLSAPPNYHYICLTFLPVTHCDEQITKTDWMLLRGEPDINFLPYWLEWQHEEWIHSCHPARDGFWVRPDDSNIWFHSQKACEDIMRNPHHIYGN